MRTIARVSRWEGCLATRVPKTIVDALDLHQGDEVTLFVMRGGRADKIAKAEESQSRAKDLLLPLRRFRGRLVADFRFDRLEANESPD
jgi:antitoxin MazE